MTQRKRATALIVAMQAIKQPLDDKRQPLWAELKALIATTADREQELRQQIKAIQDEIGPIDGLMADIDRAGNFKSERGANMLLDDLEEITNGFTN